MTIGCTCSRRSASRIVVVASVATGDRTATRDEVLTRRTQLRGMADRHGLVDPRVDDVGTVIVDSPQPGYAPIRRFATEASAVVGVWVNVVADGVPAALVATERL